MHFDGITEIGVGRRLSKIDRRPRIVPAFWILVPHLRNIQALSIKERRLDPILIHSHLMRGRPAQSPIIPIDLQIELNICSGNVLDIAICTHID